MKELGQAYTVSEELAEKCEKYVCSLYGKSGADVIDVRYALFSKNDSIHHIYHQLKMHLASIQAEQITRLYLETSLRRHARCTNPTWSWLDFKSGSIYM